MKCLAFVVNPNVELDTSDRRGVDRWKWMGLGLGG